MPVYRLFLWTDPDAVKRGLSFCCVLDGFRFVWISNAGILQIMMGNNTGTIQLFEVDRNKEGPCAFHIFTLVSESVILNASKIVKQTVTIDICLLVSEVEPVVVPAELDKPRGVTFRDFDTSVFLPTFLDSESLWCQTPSV